jgi:peptidyl-prolyl cis-trans isomerase SurA
VEQQVEESYYMARMEPAIRAYLTKMREDAYVEIKPGFVDTGASPNKRVFPIAYAAYTPPVPKKKKKIERTRFRATTHTFRQKSPQTVEAAAPEPPTAPEKKSKKDKASAVDTASMKPGKKEKIRYGQAPTKTLPSAAAPAQTEDAGAATQTAAAADEPVNPLETSAKPTEKTRFSARAKQVKKDKAKTKTNGIKVDPNAPAAADAAEVADRQTQAAPLGLAGDTSKKKHKKATATGDKTRLADKSKKPEAPAPDANAPAPAPVPAPQQ